jgi:hypothetical protein
VDPEGQADHAGLVFAARIAESGCPEASGLPVIDSALALGRLTGLTRKDEMVWLRACLAACAPITGPPEGLQVG